jgi:lysozyme
MEGTNKDQHGRHLPYRDSEGIWTIGWGRNLDTGISDDEAEYLLMNNILEKSEELGANLPWTEDLDDARRHVLLNMAFNLGIRGLLGFTNTLRAVREGRWEDAARGMLDSKWATQVGHRATELAEQMRSGIEK